MNQQLRYCWLAIALGVLGMVAGTMPAMATTYYVSPTGHDSDAGTKQQPFQTISRAAALAVAGDTVSIGAGTYREALAPAHAGTKNARITYQAATGETVVVTGADLVTGWEEIPQQANPSIWVKRGWTKVLIDGDDMTRGAAAPIGRAEQVIVNGVMYRQVMHKDELRPGTFLADPRGDKALYLVLLGQPKKAAASSQGNWWDSPVEMDNEDANQQRIEVSTRGVLCNVPAFTTVRGLTFRYAATPCQVGALKVENKGGVAEDCLVEWANGRGADVGRSGELYGEDRCTLRRVVCRFSGQLGMGGSGDALIEDCTVWDSNVKGISPGWEAGGAKFCAAHGLVVRGMRAIDNAGAGIWFDINDTDCIIERCYCDGNPIGIMVEISGNNIVRNNIVANSGRKEAGGVGILIQLSHDTLVANNTLYNNSRCGIELRYHQYVPECNLTNNRLLNNLFYGHPQAAIVMTPTPQARPAGMANNTSDYNLFYVGHQQGAMDMANPLGPLNRELDLDMPTTSKWGKTFLNGDYSLEEWRHIEGLDQHSIQWEPMLLDPDHSDFHVMDGSLALHAGIELPDVTNDFYGNPRPRGARPTIGAIEDPASMNPSMLSIPGPSR